MPQCWLLRLVGGRHLATCQRSRTRVAVQRLWPALRDGMANCQSVCTDICIKARDGHCSDGWLGDNSPEGKASCALGSDCTDCGAREVCALPGTSGGMLLPRDVVLPAVSALRASRILFMVLGSSRFPGKAQRAYGSWCRSVRNVRCLFVADDDPPLDTESLKDDPMAWLTIGNSPPPKHCCALKPGSRRTRGFFCTSHRSRTLSAQYRFLPALYQVQQSDAVKSDVFEWIVLVDDDAFVFVPRLLWILSRLDSSKAIYAGDFGSSGEATAMGIPHFACGGGGSVLSIAALRRMDIASCVKRYHTRCMQSDWMIGGCAREHNVSELRDLGCGTCDPRRLKEARVQAEVRQRLRADSCFFLQNAAPFVKELPLGQYSGAIVHGLDNTATWDFFRKHNTTHQRQRSISPKPRRPKVKVPLHRARAPPPADFSWARHASQHVVSARSG